MMRAGAGMGAVLIIWCRYTDACVCKQVVWIWYSSAVLHVLAVRGGHNNVERCGIGEKGNKVELTMRFHPLSRGPIRSDAPYF
jgi:hypothetical protein